MPVVCQKPFVKDGVAFPCGQCHPCRWRRRKVWSHRIMLESTQHKHNSFITLTYDDDHLQEHVEVRELQLFFKRLRKKIGKFRYYAVGEYGERTLRPHYHIAAFGVETCLRGQTDLRKRICCEVCSRIESCWQKGAVQVARLEPASAAYIAGYVTKKIRNAPGVGSLLKPEFQRMSLKPGLGLSAMHDVANVLLTHELEKTLEDVPVFLSHGEAHFPLGKYLRKNLRRMIGRSEKCPQSVLDKMEGEMRPLRESAFLASASLSKAIVLANKGRLASFESKRKIKKERHVI